MDVRVEGDRQGQRRGCEGSGDVGGLGGWGLVVEGQGAETDSEVEVFG